MAFPWLIQVALAVTAVLIQPDREVGKRNGTEVDTGDFGEKINPVLGRQKVTGKTIWIDGNELIEVKKSKRSIPIIGPKTTTYKYYANFAVALTCNKVKLVKVWANDELIMDFSGTDTGGNTSGADYDFKDGSDTQATSRLMTNPNREIASSGGGGFLNLITFGLASALFGGSTTTTNSGGDSGNTSHPAYNGISYLVFDRLPLEEYGNQIPTITALVVEVNDDAHTAEARNYGGGPITIDKYGRATYIDFTGINHAETWDIYSNEKVGEIEFDGGDGPIFYDDRGDNYVFRGGLLTPDIATFDALTKTQIDSHTIGSETNSGWMFFDPSGFATTTDAVGACYTYSIDAGGAITYLPDEQFQVLAEEGIGWGQASNFYAVRGNGTHVFQLKNDLTGFHHLGFRTAQALISYERVDEYGFTGAIQSTYWPAGEAYLVWGAGGGLAKFSNDGALIDQNTSLSTGFSNASLAHFINYNNPDRYVWFVRTGEFFEVDLITLEETRSVNFTDISGFTAAASPSFIAPYYLSDRHALYVVQSGESDFVVYLDRPPEQDVSVQHYVEFVAERLGIPLSRLDATAGTRTIEGAILSGDNIRRSIEQLLQVTGYDLTEEDGKIKILDRGSAPVMTIDVNALGEIDDAYRLERTIARESETPKTAFLKFADVDADFETNVAKADRPSDAVDTNNVLNIDSPFAMTVDQAKTFVERLMGQHVRERAGINLKVPAQRNARLSAGDVITVPDGSDLLDVKITRISGVEVLEIDGIVDDATVSAISLTGNPLNYQPQTLDFTAADAVAVIIDSALPDDNISSPNGVGIIARPIVSGNNVGKRDFGKSSDGETFEYIDTSQGEPIFRLINALGDVANPSVMDNGNTITIREDSRLESVSFYDLLNYPFLNLAFIWAGADWELVQFQTVTDNMDGTMTLSGLLRGRRGTEHLTGLHADNDRLVILTDGYVRGCDISDLGQPRQFVSTLEEDDDSVNVTQHTPTLESLRPYSVVDIAVDDSTGIDHIISWLRRTRIGGSNVDGSDVPLSETSENYDVEILEGSTIVRTFAVTSEQVTYTQAQQAADLSSIGAPYTVNVYQVSDEYGRGTLSSFAYPGASGDDNPHRYWRMYVTKSANSNAVSFLQWELYESDFGPNENAASLTYDASSEFNASYLAEYSSNQILGDEPGNHWNSDFGGGPHWISVDFGVGNEKNIKSLGIVSRHVTTDQSPEDFIVQYSDDGTTWTTKWVESGVSWQAGEYKRFTNPGDAASYTGSPHGSHNEWRMYSMGAEGTNSQIVFAELEMRATPSGADQCSGGTASASSIFTGNVPTFGPDNAFDNNASTIYAGDNTSGIDFDWVEYDHSSAVEVAEFALTARNDVNVTDTPKYMALQYSTDGTTWTTTYATAAQTGWVLGETRVFTDPNYI